MNIFLLRDQIIKLWKKPNRLAINSILYFINSIVVSALGAVIWWLAARKMKPEVIGLTIVLISVTQLITTTAQLGLGFSIIRYLPVIETEKTVKLINTVIFSSLVFALFLSITFLIIGPSLSESINNVFNSGQINFLFLLFVIALLLNQIIFPILAVYRYPLALLGSNLVIGVARIILIVTFTSVTTTTNIFLLLYLLPLLIVTIGILFVFLPRIIHGYKFKLQFSWSILRSIRDYSFSNYISNLLHDSPYQILPILVANKFGTAGTAFFYYPWSLFSLLVTGSASISLSLFVEGSHNSVTKIIQNLTKKAYLGAIVVTSSLSLISVILAKPLLILLGPEYVTESYFLLIILAISAIPASLIYIQVSFFRVIRIIFPIIIAYLIILFVVIFLFFVISDENLASVGWAWFCSQTIALVYLSFVYWKIK